MRSNSESWASMRLDCKLSGGSCGRDANQNSEGTRVASGDDDKWDFAAGSSFAADFPGHPTHPSEIKKNQRMWSECCSLLPDWLEYSILIGEER